MSPVSLANDGVSIGIPAEVIGYDICIYVHSYNVDLQHIFFFCKFWQGEVPTNTRGLAKTTKRIAFLSLQSEAGWDKNR